MNMINKNHLYKLFMVFILKLPTPININIFWNFGSLLGLLLMVQLLSGLILTMHFVPHVDYSFLSVIHIMQDVNYGWLIRLLHMNGASFFFFCVFMHIGRNLYYGSYKLINVWFIGVLLLLMMMSIAFLGYVLPWGQMSFWGATVITNLLSALPYIGSMLVEWLWGGFSVNSATLNRFYTFHFFLPFILIILVILHLFYLHEIGSSNPLGLISNFYKVKFHNYFTIKDMVGFIFLFLMMMLIILQFPYMLGDSENFLMANPMVTPIHIQPEWYFLFAYTILRSIPNKLSGVLALLFSIMVLFTLPFLNKCNFQGLIYYPMSKKFFWFFTFNLIMLTWLGSQPVEFPFVEMSQFSGMMYFMYYYLDSFFKMYWDLLIS